ncbi:DUF4011 domain-containing protein [Lolliginicoccus suaedae]|uniref:DUF4011 domain-containing protein n=1 Tax=Lolliginicoccus suaedae TaxID=2605429 RepID=UPI0011EBDC93|nr:DUF4011 domain-containing protein [Lolliginicoccus suaedae]
MAVFGFDTKSFTNEVLRADIEVPPALFFALVHNSVPMVQLLRVENLTDEDLRDVSATVAVHGPSGVLAAPWHGSLAQLRAESAHSWDDFHDFRLPAQALRDNDEAYPISYQIDINCAGGMSLSFSVDSRVLAHNEWIGHPSVFESIGAFVQPNSPVVPAVLREASEILERKTGTGALVGYQEGPERVALSAAAIFEALRSRSITYVVLPASFESTGQKVRTSTAVLADRIGNCIDLSVTYAACLEAAGIRPVIFILDDHAFAGFHSLEDRLPEVTVRDRNYIHTLTQSGRVVPVETTCLTGGSTSKSFGDAHLEAMKQLDQVDRFNGLVDIHFAHRSSIRPFPTQQASAPSPNVEEQTGEQSSATTAALTLPASLAKILGEEDNLQRRIAEDDGAPDRIAKWRRALLDLSLRNPLLKLPKRGKAAEIAVPSGLLAVLDDQIHDGKPVELLAHDQVSGVNEMQGVRTVEDLDPSIINDELRKHRKAFVRVASTAYVRRMRELRREAETMLQETGSNYLYLTLGSLVHQGDSGEAHAPLFLLPVRIQGGNGNRPFAITIDGDEIASSNHCLVHWLRVKHNVRIPELEEPITDDSGIDIHKSLHAIRKALVDNQLPFRIEETASVRLLQFATFQMWRDLVDHWPVFMRNPVVKHLVEHPGDTFTDPMGPPVGDTINELDLQLPIPADGSQMRAIDIAIRGHSFVLEGPPGTGKSQTIANLISHAVRNGKKVLFVAEKQAALEVVKRRLDAVGLADFCLDLHGRKQSPTTIKAQLRAALTHSPVGSAAKLDTLKARQRKPVSMLSQYPARVHGINSGEHSLWSAYEYRQELGDGITATIPGSFFRLSKEQQDQATEIARELTTAASSASLRAEHPWRISGLRTIDASTEPHRFLAAAEELESARAVLGSLPPALEQHLRGLRSPVELRAIAACAALSAAGQLPEPGRIISEDSIATVAQFRERHNDALRYFSDRLFVDADFDGFSEAAIAADSGLLGKKKRRTALADQLNKFVPGALKLDEASVLGAFAAAQTAREEARQLSERVAHAPNGWFPTDRDAVAQLKQARERGQASTSLHTEHPDLWQWMRSHPAPVAELRHIADAWTQWLEALSATSTEIEGWRGELHWVDAWHRDGSTWAEQLHGTGLLPVQRWGRVLAHIDQLRGLGLDSFADQVLDGDLDAADIEIAYLRGLAHTAITERRNSSELTYFDRQVHEAHISAYTDLNRELREILPYTVGQAVINRRPSIDLHDKTTGELVRQLERKRGGMSFRELLAKYPAEILSLTPCFLMSPASVASFIDPTAVQFDIVVFDEASQIRVQEAVGAMGRAQSVVVVGDSRQMPPTSVMQASTTEDEADNATTVPEDLDSILTECIESGLPQEWLSWHYRSADESLIAFSNSHYYEQRLASLPSPGRSGHTGISWQNVHGEFDRGTGGTRTNKIEAEAIVSTITELLADGPASIGVVTFNVQQRDLLLNLLEESTNSNIQAALARTDGEALFVKNLENVQGDERDIVLFSLAFSKDPKTGILPLNFGPLIRQGGERRLNVAITRARKKVILFSSFDPQDIDLRRTHAVGMRHLREYIEYASLGGTIDSDSSQDGVASELGKDLERELELRGIEVAHNHGMSGFKVDLAARRIGSEKWEAAILLDNPAWAKRPTVADRDGAPTLLTSIMGWPHVVRVWLPEWLIDPDAVLDRIEKAVSAEAGIDVVDEAATVDEPADEIAAPVVEPVAEVAPFAPDPTASVPEPAAPEHVDATPVVVTSSAPPKSAMPQPVATPATPAPTNSQSSSGHHLETYEEYLGTLINAQQATLQDRIEGITAIIRTEGPVVGSRIHRAYVLAAGGQRVTKPNREALNQAMHAMAVRKLVITDDPLLQKYPKLLTYRVEGQPEVKLREIGPRNEFDEIPPLELATVIARIAHEHGGFDAIDSETLMRETLKIYGKQRLTEGYKTSLRVAIGLAHQV